MLDPVELYKDGICRKIPAIDAPAWVRLGWSVDPNSLSSAVVATLLSDSNSSSTTEESDPANAISPAINEEKLKKKNVAGNTLQQS